MSTPLCLSRSKFEIGNRRYPRCMLATIYPSALYYFRHGSIPEYKCDCDGRFSSPHQPRSPVSSGQLVVYELNLLHRFLPLRFVPSSPFFAQAYGSTSQAFLVIASNFKISSFTEAVFSQSGSMPTNRNRSAGYRMLVRCSSSNLARLKSCETTVTSIG